MDVLVLSRSPMRSLPSMRPTSAALLTLDAITRARGVRATDGVISTLVWENPRPARGSEIFVSVPEVTEEHLEPVRHRVSELLLLSQEAS